MSDDLRRLENWAAPLLAKLSSTERRKLNQTLARDLRRSQQQRIATQREPDGTPYAPRKKQQRSKKGRIKRQMFSRLRQARRMRLRSTPDEAAIAFMGRAARIARVHQYGLRDRPGKGQADVRYERRELLGFSVDDLRLIEEKLIQHLTNV